MAVVQSCIPWQNRQTKGPSQIGQCVVVERDVIVILFGDDGIQRISRGGECVVACGPECTYELQRGRRSGTNGGSTLAVLSSRAYRRACLRHAISPMSLIEIGRAHV